MSRRKHPITNVTFSLVDTKARVRLCFYGHRLIMLGVRYAYGRGAERMLTPGGRRWKQLCRLAGVNV